MPCDKCPKRSICREICPTLESHLPKITYTHLQGDEEEDINLSRARRQKTVRLILEMRHHLTERERAAVDLFLNSSLTLRGVARTMSISRQTVITLLRAARRRIVRVMTRERRTA